MIRESRMHCAFVVLLVIGVAARGRAAVPIPASEWTPKARLSLAHALMVEGGNDVDRAAIPFVLARRWRLQRQGWTFDELVRRYSRPLSVGARTPRQLRVLVLDWADVPASVRALVQRWGAGLVRDPCPDALHWGSRSLLRGLPESRRTCQHAANVFTRG